MRTIVHYSVCLVFLIIAATELSQSQVNRRPKIGLVLSGGGAKGLAHIGVLKVLEEEGIPIDYITGTSMGSIVGGLYACGYSVDRIEKLTRSINWDELLLDQISRRNISIEEKDDFGKYILEFPLVKGRVQLPKGMVDGQKVSILLSRLTWQVHSISDFDKLPIPFRCVATDIVNVKPVVLKSGYLPDAVRASMAIPSFFNPIEIDGRLLVDGGVIRNFPVEDARDMGADIIIGVEVSAGLYTREQLNSAFRIMDQASTYQITLSNQEQEKKCDILIKPEIGNYNMFSFDAVDSLIALGEKAARSQISVIHHLADSIRALGYQYTRVQSPPEPDSVYIKAIRFEGLSKVSKGLVTGNLQLPDSGWITNGELEKGIERVYGTRFFERVNYKIDPQPRGSVLTLRLKEQPNNYFKLSLNHDPYLKAGILLNSTFRNLLGEGSRLALDLRLGEYPAFGTYYTIHTSVHPNLGMGIRFNFNTFLAKFYTPQGVLLANYDINHYLGELDILSAISNAFLIRSGLQLEKVDVSHQLEAYDTAHYSMKAVSWYTRFRFDTQDRTVFPRKGDYFYGEIKSVLGSHYSSNIWRKSFWRIVASYNKTVPLSKRLVLNPGFNVGINFSNNVYFTYLNYLGGEIPGESTILPFAGMNLMAVPSPNLAMASVKFRAELWKDKFLTFIGNIGQKANDIRKLDELGKTYLGAGISAGLRTIIGPVEFTVSRGNVSKRLIAEIRIGYTF